MLNLRFKKEVLDDAAKDAKDFANLLKGRWDMDFWATIIVISVFTIPFSTFLASVVYMCKVNTTLYNILLGGICTIAFGVGTVAFYRIFKAEILHFRNGIAINLYVRHYLIKGNALTQEDFKQIEETNEVLHYVITRLKAQGKCYSVCFEILKSLKKGEIVFLRVINTHPEQEVYKKYTMHVLYVKDGWCYDTYSERQFVFEDYLKICQGKVYNRYIYDDVSEYTYEQFITKEAPMIKKWADENDCYENCSED